jgi:hypothetical protein
MGQQDLKAPKNEIDRKKDSSTVTRQSKAGEQKRMACDPALDLPNVPVRSPRWPVDELVRLLNAIHEPQIVLRSGKEGAEIAIRLHNWKGEDGHATLKFLRASNTELQTAFRESLWQTLDGHRSSLWSELSVTAVEAYRNAWFHLYQAADVGSPRYNEKLPEKFLQIKRRTGRGRKQTPQIEAAGLNRRFRELSDTCTALHKSICELRRPKLDGSFRHTREIRDEAFERTRFRLLGKPIFRWIFGGHAFKWIVSLHHRTKNPPTRLLHDPKSWTARQLAIALLAHERNQVYATIQKRIAEGENVSRNRI